MPVLAQPPKKLPRSRLRRALAVLACGTMVAILCGCQTIRYYGQAVAGECQILTHRQPIAKLVADTNTPAPLRAKLQQIQQIRQFAADQLRLPVGDSYLSYVDLHREWVVWNVTAAPALSLEPKTWWYPFVGRASYRGYFNEKSARDFGDKLAKQGWDVHVDGIPTYSTLGWFADPLLSSFVNEPDWYLAETIFHESTHRRLFIAGDTDFNEALATFVSMEGVKRWYLAGMNAAGYERYVAIQAQDRQFVDLVAATRAQLQAVYQDATLSDEAKLARKTNIIAEMRARHETLKASWGGKSPYERWFSEPINNAKLNTVSAYYDLVPAFAALLKADKGDLEEFFGDVARLGQKPLAERHQALKAYLPQQAP